MAQWLIADILLLDVHAFGGKLTTEKTERKAKVGGC